MLINDIQIGADLATILNELQSQLHINKIDLLRDIKDTPDNIQVTCPYHKGGQERKPSMGIKKTDGTCHCFRAGTMVLTNQGAKPIESLVDDVSTIINGNGEWEEVRFKKYGKSELYQINLTQDQTHKTIYATPNHEWFIHKKRDTKQTVNLQNGDYLQSYISENIPWSINIDGLIHGIVYGDGYEQTLYHTKRVDGISVIDKTHIRGYVYRVGIPAFTKKSRLVSYFENLPNWTIRYGFRDDKKYYRVDSHIFKECPHYKEVPDINQSIDYLISFLCGYFACDGSYDLNSISCCDYDKLNAVRDICIRCGISVRDIKSVTRDTQYAKNNTLYLLPILRQSLTDDFYILENNKIQRKYCRSRWRVESVVKTDLIEDVYCCETSTQSFVLDGNILTHNCFTCGQVATLQQMISHCFGRPDDMIGAFGWRWIMQNFVSLSIEERKPIELGLTRGESTSQKSEIEYVSEEELDSYRYYHPYMYKRKLTDEVINRFDIGYDVKTKCVTFPIRDITGGTLLVARRSVLTKYFNYPAQSEKPLYGIYELSQLEQMPSEIIVCESMLDALTAWVYGKYAVALNGLGTVKQMQQLNELKCRKLILATDADDAGMNARERIKRSVRGKIITEYKWDLNIAKDLNDMSEEYFNNLKEIY